MFGGVETWLKANSSGLLGSTHPIVPWPISYDCERLWVDGMVDGIEESPNVAGISCGGVHGMPGPYNSPDIPGPTFAPAVLSTPMKVKPEDIDAFLLKAPSRLVGGVCQPVSTL